MQRNDARLGANKKSKDTTRKQAPYDHTFMVALAIMGCRRTRMSITCSQQIKLTMQIMPLQTWDGNIKARCNTIILAPANTIVIMGMIKGGKTTLAEKIDITRIIIIVGDEEPHRFITTREMVGITIDETYLQREDIYSYTHIR